MIKEVDYTRCFGERLKHKQKRMSPLRSAIFEITYRCNLRCRHCCIVPEETERELSSQEIKLIFEQLAEGGCFHLTLTGGEPLLREDMLSLLDYGRKIGLFIHLFTNATLITPQVADSLKELQLTSLELSFHSLKRERFDWFTQVEGSFDKVMRAIHLLKERKVELALKFNITKLNFDEIEDLKTFAKDLEAKPQWDTFLIARCDGRRDNLFLRLEPEQVVETEERVFLGSIHKGDAPPAGAGEDKEFFSNRTPGEESWRKPLKDKLFQCGAARSSLAINPYGELKPCLRLFSPTHSILKGSLEEGYKQLNNFIESVKPGPEHKCFVCRWRNFCSSCPAEAKFECGDMNLCPPHLRRVAQLTARKQARLPKA